MQSGLDEQRGAEVLVDVERLDEGKGRSYGWVYWWVIGVAMVYWMVARVWGLWMREGLWLDEAAIGQQILFRGWGEMHEPLGYGQSSALGFLYLCKLGTMIVGGDLGLRLMPTVLGLGFAPLMFLYAKRFGKVAGLVVLMLAVLGGGHLYFSLQMKHYSMDVLATLVGVWLARRCLDDESNRCLIELGVWGVVVSWLSYVQVMVLGGVGGVLLVNYLVNKRKLKVGLLMGFGGLWLLSLVVHYRGFLASQSGDEKLGSYWEYGFAPVVITGVKDLLWYPKNYFYAFEHPMGMGLKYVAGFVWLIGAWVGWRRYRWESCLWLGMLPMVWLLSAMKIYPSYDRALMFLLPMMVLFLGLGFVEIVRLMGDKYVAMRWAVVGGVMGVMLWPSVLTHGEEVWLREDRLDGHDAAVYLAEHYVEGEKLYADALTGVTFRYYERLYELGVEIVWDEGTHDGGGMGGVNDRTIGLLDEVLGDGRGWVLVENFEPRDGSESMEMRVKKYLDERGELKLRYVTTLGILMCYELK
ncbi:hypothetical protein JD969_04675 [Planctomycetota bacterium]|nr:hypothetical protein JD969_04675 [Planctomycetota bacterium]